MNDLDKAREWAGRVYAQEPDTQATCRVIQSLPDQWIDAEKVQELIDTYKHARDGNAAGTEGWVMNHLVVRNLESLLLAPPLPTLADMTPEEREACQWMQAISDPDSGYTDGPVVIVQVQDDRSMLMWEDGSFDTRYHQHITPLPDLPPLKWPAQEPQPVVKTLHTVEDYENAAIGTVVRRQGIPWLAATFHKCVYGIWNSTGDHEYPPSEMAGTARTVLWEPPPPAPADIQHRFTTEWEATDE